MSQRKEQESTKQVKQQLKIGDLDLDDSDALSLNFEEEFQERVIPHDNQNIELIICCCRKHISHDETMKFKLKVNKNLKLDDNADMMNIILFQQREEGEIV